VVNRFVYSTSGARTLVLLNANMRGRTLHLVLQRNYSGLLDPPATSGPAPLLSASLAQAPWEDVS
jgi:hypothetical protein